MLKICIGNFLLRGSPVWRAAGSDGTRHHPLHAELELGSLRGEPALGSLKMSLGLVKDLNLGGVWDPVGVELRLLGAAAGCNDSSVPEQRGTGPGLLAQKGRV